MEVVQDVAEDPTMKTFWCPGCKTGHFFKVGPWHWDGDRSMPTVFPSISVSYNGPDAGDPGAPQAKCHFFVRAGVLEYLPDSTHALAGQSVPMEPQ